MWYCIDWQFWYANSRAVPGDTVHRLYGGNGHLWDLGDLSAVIRTNESFGGSLYASIEMDPRQQAGER